MQPASRPRRRYILNLAWAAYLPIALAALAVQVQVLLTLVARPWAYAIDYRLYRTAADIGLRHGWSHLYDLALQRSAITAFWPRAGWPDWWRSGRPFWTPMVTPPPAAWLAAPFGALPAPAAEALWISLLGVAIVAMSLVAAPASPLARLRYLSLPVLTWVTTIALVSGNLVVLVALAAVIAWRLLAGGRDRAAGLVLAVSFLKPQLALALPPLLLVSGRWRPVLWWAGAGIVLAAVSVLTLGAHGLASYRELLSYAASFQGEQQFSLGQLHLPAPSAAVLALAMFGAFAAVAWRTRARGPAPAVALGLIASLLLSPYLNAEDFLLLLPAGILLVRTRRSNAEAALAVGLILSATPASQGVLWPALAVAALVLAWLGVSSSRSASSPGPEADGPGGAPARRIQSPAG